MNLVTEPRGRPFEEPDARVVPSPASRRPDLEASVAATAAFG